MDDCIFCKKMKNEEFKILHENGYWMLVNDGYEVSPGHMLIISKMHFEHFFETSHRANLHLYPMIIKAKKLIEKKFSPNGYNIGLNAGKAAGQTVMHTHIHVIPRYEDDCLDPTGGIRNVIPGKGKY